MATPRTIITHLELENFKSYAGVQTIGPFHKCFSSVVGPNGSGKSNVIDALLFVFGWRASKIRQSKVSELIHSSAAHPNLDFARVTVHFIDILDTEEGGDSFEEVAGTALTVTRQAFKNNTSKYLLNDRAATFKDVQALLRGRGIDLDHNRFLILQGEVESIAMLKPKAPNEHEDGLLEYLEDIIGSNRHVEAIGIAEKELEDLNEQCSERLNRVKAVEKERASLDGPRREAQEYLEREVEMLALQDTVHQLEFHSAKQRHDLLEEKVTEKQTALESEREKLAEVTAVLEEMQAEFDAEKADYEAVVAEMDRCKSEFQVFERKDIKFREDLKHEKKGAKSCTEAIKKESKKLEGLREKISSAESASPELQAAIEKTTVLLEKQETALEKMMEDVKDEAAELRAALVEKQTALDPWAAQMSEHESQMNLLSSERTLLESKQEGAGDALTKAHAATAEAIEKMDDKKEQQERLTAKLVEQTAEINKCERELQAAEVEEGKTGKQCSSQREKVEQARVALQEQQSSASGGLAKALAKASAQGKLSGFCGRLGDLATIDAEYDVAITSACGSLNCFVVNSTTDGEKCVQFLRQHNLGVASFIMLDKMSQWERRANAPYDPLSDAPRLFDLVNPSNPKYSGALYYALRDTLVARDIEHANSLAFGDKRVRRRVVTLAGEVIEQTGTLSGGGNKKMSGGMKLASGQRSRVAAEGDVLTAADVERMERELAATEEALSDVRDTIQDLKERLVSLTKSQEKLQMEQRKLEAEVTSLKTVIAQCKQNEASAKATLAESKESEKRIKELGKEIEKCQAKIDKTAKSHDKAHADVEAAKKALDNVGGPKAKKLRDTIENLRDQLDSDKRELTKADVQSKASEKAIAKAEKTLKDKEAALEAHQKATAALEAELKQLTEDAFQVQEAYKHSQTLVDSKAADLKLKKSGFEGHSKEQSKLRAKEVDLEEELRDIKHRFRDADNRMRSCQKQREACAKKLAKSKQMLARTHSADEITEEESTTPVPMDENSDTEVVAHKSINEAPAEEEEEEEKPAKRAKGVVARAGEDMTPEEMEAVDRKDVEHQIKLLQQALEQIKPNFSALERWEEKDAEYTSRSKDLAERSKVREAKRRHHDSLKAQRLQEFMDGFTNITMKLKEIYQMITLGGDAELEIVDSLDPFSEGVVFSVRPPKKSWKNISNLSGGEKTLSSLALVFALHHFKPTPLYVMDEIDAALDFKNVSIVAHFVKERTKNAQFIIISLRNHMFELADRLVGIYKTEDQTKSVTINPSKFTVGSSGSGAVPVAATPQQGQQTQALETA